MGDNHRNGKPDMSVNIAGVAFKNPVMTASGTFGSGMEYSDFEIGRASCRERV